MVDYSNSAFYTVRQWMLNELFSSGILTESDYTDSSAIVPIQQIPEAFGNKTDAPVGLPDDAPFIIYDLLVPGGYDTEYWNCRDEVVLWIYDYDIEKLMEIKDFLYDLFRRFDLTADDVNQISDTYKFHFFDIMMGLPSSNIDMVLGRYGLNMVISYQYTRPVGANGRFAS